MHKTIREGDELYCRSCGKRWATDEDEPTCGVSKVNKVKSDGESK